MIRAVIALAASLLAACASVPSGPVPHDAQAAFAARQKSLSGLTAWTLQGRVALRTPEQGWQASLTWAHEPDRQVLDLVGPFGGGRMRLSANAHGATLRDSAGGHYYGENATALLERTTGWRVPLEGLDYWVLGLPAPAVPFAQEIDEYGRLKTLMQLGWKIEYLDYGEQEGRELPTRLFVSRRLAEPVPGPEEAMLTLRLAVQRWSLGE